MSDPLTSAYARAFALAHAGDCPDWPSVAEQLAREGYSPTVISGFGRDRGFKNALTGIILCTTERRKTEVVALKATTRMSPALPIKSLARTR